MDLSEIRAQIDAIDDELTRLFVRRMACSTEAAAAKRRAGQTVYDPGREKAIVERLCALAEEEYAPYVEALYRHIFALSRRRQAALRREGDARPGHSEPSPNIVLIGMPGCGKTTIGRALARLMNRPFIDCDEEVEHRAGVSIVEIFAREGEAAFRALETEVIADACAAPGAVIATGGGAVLREENVRALRRTGRVALLERRLDELSMDGRPLSESLEALERLWNDRRDRYFSAADFIVKNDAAIGTVAARVKNAYYENLAR